MGCGSAKLASNAHIPGSTDNESGLIDSGTLDNFNSSSDSSTVPSTSRDILSNTVHNKYSTAMGIKGNSKIRVTLSDDGSLLEVETVTIESIKPMCSSTENSPILNESICNCGKCDPQTCGNLQQDIHFPDIGQGLLTIKEHSQTSSNNSNNCRINTDDNRGDNRSENSCSNDNCLNTDIYPCNCKNNSIKVSAKGQCCSLPDIKSQSTNGGVFISPSYSTTKANCYSFQQTKQSVEINGTSLSFSNKKTNPGGKSFQNNCVASSAYSLSKQLSNVDDSKNQVGCGTIKRSISNCYPQDKRSTMQTQWYHETEGADDILQHKYSSVERSMSYDGHRGKQLSPAVADYTCLDYCARKCYNNPSFPHVAMVHPKQPQSPLGTMSSNRSITNVKTENDSVTNNLYCDSMRNGTPINMINSHSSNVIDQLDKTNGSILNTPKQQTPYLSNGQQTVNCSNGIAPVKSSISRESSGVSSLSSYETSSATSSTPRRVTLKDKLQSTNASSSPILSKMKCGKRGFNILKIKASSEDSPQVSNSSPPFKCSHSMSSFDGKPTSNEENDQVEPFELNIPDVSYVHNDFFNEFGDLYDEDYQETCV